MLELRHLHWCRRWRYRPECGLSRDKHTRDLVNKPLNTDICQRIVMHQNENPTGNASSTSGCPWTLFKLFTFMITFTFVIFSYTGIPELCHLYEIMEKGDFTGCFNFVKCLQSWSCPVRLSYFKCLQSLSCPVRLSYYKCKTRRPTTPLQQSLDVILDLIKLVMVECKTSVTSIDAADEDMVENHGYLETNTPEIWCTNR